MRITRQERETLYEACYLILTGAEVKGGGYCGDLDVLRGKRNSIEAAFRLLDGIGWTAGNDCDGYEGDDRALGVILAWWREELRGNLAGKGAEGWMEHDAAALEVCDRLAERLTDTAGVAG